LGKRLTRYWGKALPEKLPSLIGQAFDLVLKNGRTYHVSLLSFKEKTLEVKNFRNKKSQVPLSDVDEIVVMAESAY